MARDNSPKERQKKQLERKQGKKAGHNRVLIVSEGSQTEPNYFREIRREYRLHAASVEVQHSAHGTSPLQVVEYAELLFTNGDPNKLIQARAFEQVYAVFDRDQHQSYFQALDKAQSLDGKLRNDNKLMVSFKAIASVPSFELWLLLHFEDIKQPFHRNDVLQRLKKHIPDYEKGAKQVFATTRSQLKTATERAQELAKRFNAHTDPEPYTGIHELVNSLIPQKKG